MAMSKIMTKAYAKLNLTLDVLSRLPDGYHEMLMIMQSVSLADDLQIDLNHSGRFVCKTNLPYLPNDERNLASRAAKLFFTATQDTKTGALITINKRIPVCAGLGGGSSDAAAVLTALNAHTGAGLSTERLCELGAELGSDVPFCVMGGTALASGRGEELEALPPLPRCHVLICKPEFSVSTPWLFRQLDNVKIKNHPDTGGCLAAIRSGDLSGAARRMYNVFEDVLPRRCAEVAVIKGVMLGGGALGACLTGTGSAVFGIYESLDSANAALEILRGSYGFCEIAEPV